MERNAKTNRLYWFVSLAVILIAAAGYGVYRFWYLPSQDVEMKESSLHTALVRRGDIILYAAGAGELIPSIEVEVSFDISDGVKEELVELMVEVGDVVEEGDILARLDESDRQENLLLAERDLRELTSPASIAELELSLAKTKLELQDEIDDLVGLISIYVYSAEKRVDTYSTALAQAQAAYDGDPSEENSTKLSEAQQDLSDAESNLAAQWNYYQTVFLPDNYTRSYRDENGDQVSYIDAPSEAEIDSARAKVDLSEANIAELEVLLEALISGEDLPEEATGSQVSTIRKAREAVDAALEDLDATNLIAPIAGTITEINVTTSPCFRPERISA